MSCVRVPSQVSSVTHFVPRTVAELLRPRVRKRPCAWPKRRLLMRLAACALCCFGAHALKSPPASLRSVSGFLPFVCVSMKAPWEKVPNCVFPPPFVVTIFTVPWVVSIFAPIRTARGFFPSGEPFTVTFPLTVWTTARLPVAGLGGAALAAWGGARKAAAAMASVRMLAMVGPLLDGDESGPQGRTTPLLGGGGVCAGLVDGQLEPGSAGPVCPHALPTDADARAARAGCACLPDARRETGHAAGA